MALGNSAKTEEAEVPAELRRSLMSNHFALTGEVIASSFGSTVFLGAERASGASVAVKLVQKPQYEGPEAEEELQRSLEELRLHAAVPPHPHVLQLLAAEETPSSFLLVTPFMSGGNLWDLMKYGQTYPECEVRNCASQILASLSHVHACGIMHGDLKPQNLLLQMANGRLVMRLCDFGLARYVGGARGQVEFTGLYGTPGWLAPEQILETDFGLAVDLFASGLMLFQMLGGYKPFEPAATCLEAAADFDERYWCHVGAACRDFVATLLATNPDERSTSGQLLEHSWLASPSPAEPSEEAMRRLATSGLLPSKEVCFWPSDQLPLYRPLAMPAEKSSFTPADELQEVAFGEELKRSLQVLPCH